MTALVLRILAVVFMLIDHVGFLLSGAGNPFVIVLRLIGRMAFPMFAFLIANGFRHTHSRPIYALRLFILALVSEIPYDLFSRNQITLYRTGSRLIFPMLDNVCFTLLLGLLFLCIHAWCKKRGGWRYVLDVAALLVIAETANLIDAEYGMPGVLLIAFFGIFDLANKRERPFAILGLCLFAFWDVIFTLCPLLLYRLGLNLYTIPSSGLILGRKLSKMGVWRIASLLALPFLLAYNNKKGELRRPFDKIVQYAFYAYYPLQLAAFYFLRLLFRI
ncbi:MAG: hypothetical protein IJU41_08985 [Clostridia bacterium]|nr:hypothetical protein [Clostridia bacterium]